MFNEFIKNMGYLKDYYSGLSPEKITERYGKSVKPGVADKLGELASTGLSKKEMFKSIGDSIGAGVHASVDATEEAAKEFTKGAIDGVGFLIDAGELGIDAITNTAEGLTGAKIGTNLSSKKNIVDKVLEGGSKIVGDINLIKSEFGETEKGKRMMHYAALPMYVVGSIVGPNLALKGVGATIKGTGKAINMMAGTDVGKAIKTPIELIKKYATGVDKTKLFKLNKEMEVIDANVVSLTRTRNALIAKNDVTGIIKKIKDGLTPTAKELNKYDDYIKMVNEVKGIDKEIIKLQVKGNLVKVNSATILKRLEEVASKIPDVKTVKIIEAAKAVPGISKATKARVLSLPSELNGKVPVISKLTGFDKFAAYEMIKNNPKKFVGTIAALSVLQGFDDDIIKLFEDEKSNIGDTQSDTAKQDEEKKNKAKQDEAKKNKAKQDALKQDAKAKQDAQYEQDMQSMYEQLLKEQGLQSSKVTGSKGDPNKKLSWQVSGFEVYYDLINQIVWTSNGKNYMVLEKEVPDYDTADGLSPVDYEQVVYSNLGADKG